MKSASSLPGRFNHSDGDQADEQRAASMRTSPAGMGRALAKDRKLEKEAGDQDMAEATG